VTKKDEEISFENAFARLEEILEKLHSGAVTLDESLKLYEEADALITSSSKKLSDAEQKIEKLIKQRNGSLALDADQRPLSEPFNPSSAQSS